ncbi:MAG: septum formation protein Maf [Bacteroidaceae bacterium]|jgi:septum formation protein|nr:septum formation protein Maf [Bacteroidaceae bacterium]
MKLILASNSPRRKQLLAGLDLPFEVRVKDGIDESYPEDLPAEEVPVWISRRKAEAYDIADDEVLITADTVVAVGGRILGKPASPEEAKQMLRSLSGRTHHVITGVTLRVRRAERGGADDYFSFNAVTEVTFTTLSREQIDYYVATYKPMDKAGAYGIQEWIGYVGVTGIQGSYYNVMGLPVQRLSQALADFVGIASNVKA